LKLAAHLAQASKSPNQLFILDEPTTGLHPADVSTLVGALHRLVDGGHSVVVVEHDTDVVWSSDWVIDLGPEGGNEGGRLVGEGPPERIAELDSLTGRALRERPAKRMRIAAHRPPPHRQQPLQPAFTGFIRIQGAREHNLQSLDVDVPRGRLVAVTGVSGSGKSTFAFDVLYAEGQRRFLDCLPTYARQFIRPLARPEVDHIDGLPPTVALEQRLSRGTPLSTAGTVSEVYHYLRLLFAALGSSYCPRCGVLGEAANAAGLAERIAEDFSGSEVMLLAPLVRKRKGFHSEVVTAVAKRGISEVRIDGTIHSSLHPPTLDRYRLHDVDAVIARLPADAQHMEQFRSAVALALDLSGNAVLVAVQRKADRFYSTRRSCPKCGAGLPPPDPRMFTWSQR
ncbi:MAG: excinuclease ABC subunit A, partial [Chloroflexota bacterium]|nr:excinuclease ABC subunit A [Chloroflexota bacterium]